MHLGMMAVENKKHKGESQTQPGARVSLPRLPSRGRRGARVLYLLYGVAALCAMFSSTLALAAITLTESSIRGTLVVDTKRPNTDKLTVRGAFGLGSGEAANPATETVVLTVGPFSQTLPPGSFEQKASTGVTTWTFKGPKPGIKHMVLTRTGSDWTLSARANRLNLSATTNPITMRLQIGDDTAASSRCFLS